MIPETRKNAILLLDKPHGLTSQQSVSIIKRLFQNKKAGHTGSLDPIATGLLPICLGEATKFSQFLLKTDKHYYVKAQLGIRTDTGDAQGAIIEEKPVSNLEEAQLNEVLSKFRGDLLQIPPMFSAIKHKGQPLYRLARKGEIVERQPRPIHIHALTLLSYETDHIALEVKCSKGTYIRTLIEDIGIALGCLAHVIELRRLSVGQYHIDQSVSLEHIESFTSPEERVTLLLPLEHLVPEWPAVRISKPAAFYLKRGQALALPNTPAEGWVRLLLKPDNKLVGIGHMLSDGRVTPYRWIND